MARATVEKTPVKLVNGFGLCTPPVIGKMTTADPLFFTVKLVFNKNIFTFTLPNDVFPYLRDCFGLKFDSAVR